MASFAQNIAKAIASEDDLVQILVPVYLSQVVSTPTDTFTSIDNRLRDLALEWTREQLKHHKETICQAWHTAKQNSAIASGVPLVLAISAALAPNSSIPVELACAAVVFGVECLCLTDSVKDQ